MKKGKRMDAPKTKFLDSDGNVIFTKDSPPMPLLPPRIVVGATNIRRIMVEVPAAPPPAVLGFQFKQAHVNIQLTDVRQKRALWWVLSGLRQSHTTLANGKHCDRVVDVLRYILEQAADAMEQIGKLDEPTK